MTCYEVPTGRGSEARLAVLNALCALPPLQTGESFIPITIDNSGTPVTKGAVTVPIQALPASYTIATGQWLGFVNQTTGEEYPVAIAADAAGGATSLTTEPTWFEMADASVAEFPSEFGARTAANFNFQNNTSSIFTFDSESYQQLGVTSLQGDIGFDGVFRQLDVGVSMALLAGPNFRKMWASLCAPPIQGFDQSWKFSGQVVFQSTPVQLNANDIINMNVTAAFTGPIDIEQPVVTTP